MPPTIRAQGHALVDLGVDLEMPDRLFVPPRSYPGHALAGRMGTIRTGPAQYGQIERTARGYLRGESAAARTALEARLADLLFGTVVLAVDDGQSAVRETVVRTTRLDFSPQAGRLAPIASTLDWRFLLEEGSWRIGTYSLALPTGIRVALPVGTAPSEYVVRVFGPTSNPWSLTWRRFTGEPLATMTFGFVVTDTSVVTIDGGAMTAQLVTGGGAPSKLTFTGDYPPAGISPDDAARGAMAYATLELSSGVGEIWYPLRSLT